jgi:hypothetical protein
MQLFPAVGVAEVEVPPSSDQGIYPAPPAYQ